MYQPLYSLNFIESIILSFLIMIMPVGLHMIFHSWGMFHPKHGKYWTLGVVAIFIIIAIYLFFFKGQS